MLLGKIFGNGSDMEIRGIGYGGKCAEGDLYFCLHDGDRLARDMAFALERGAAAIAAGCEVRSDIPSFVCENVRAKFALASAAFYGNPADRLTLVGVTGTNGKTTTTHIIKSIMEAAGHKVGLIGTNGVSLAGDESAPTLTTPDPPELHRTLADMLARGADTVVMEVSAHALALKKTEGIRFAVSAFTNLTQDHLDFFGSMEKYAAAKKSLFDPARSAAAAINVDDETGIEIARSAMIPVVTYGCENPSDVFGIDYRASEKGCRFVANVMDDIMVLDYCAPGRFNMSNVLCAAAVAKMLGVGAPAIKRGVKNVRRVDGRFEIISRGGKRVVVDYAHTPDGLGKILRAVREITDGRVIAVFGCGGDRDTGKRAVMGEIADELADFAVITSDNPRSEDPVGIMNQIASGFVSHNYKMISDRREGIKYALDMCGAGDTVVVAGKGHEKTQETAGVKTRFSDAETVKELLG